MRPAPAIRRCLIACANLGLGVVLAACSESEPAGTAPLGAVRPQAAPAVLHPIEVRNPSSLGVVDTDLRDASGGVVGIACETCHAAGQSAPLSERDAAPAGFHGGIRLVHGTLRCASCHDPEDRSRLRLADGEPLAMRDVIRLCGQCHGSQHRDFWQGAHGGGRGYWDRSRGPWIRNSCVACHAPHAPAYPTVLPAPPPNDRFAARKVSPNEGVTDE